jgi:hypothetical protein
MRTDAIRRPERRELLGLAERRLAFDGEHEHAPWRPQPDHAALLVHLEAQKPCLPGAVTAITARAAKKGGPKAAPVARRQEIASGCVSIVRLLSLDAGQHTIGGRGEIAS